MGLASAATGGVNGSAPKYDRSKQGTAPGLASTAAAYNPDTDVTATAAGSEKKNKVGAPHLPQASFLQAVTGGIVHQATFLLLWPCRYSTLFCRFLLALVRSISLVYLVPPTRRSALSCLGFVHRGCFG